ncbi:MAG: aminoacyl-tRNA hydrolase [Acidobacteriales bacterium]|nr:aminoacyl-tRNA hydrolase [Terriglobales bacterium]
MKLIVGLGNPGIEYQFTPHNLGFLLVDRIAEDCGVKVGNRHCRSLTARAEIAGEQVVLAKPETYMNLSGLAVRELVDEYELTSGEQLIIAHDELAFPFGTLRIRERGLAGGHNGLESVIGALGTEKFVRVRMGIAPERPVRDGAHYVTAPFRKGRYKAVDEMLERAAEAVKVILTDGVSKAMNRFNQRPKGVDDEGSVTA